MNGMNGDFAKSLCADIRHSREDNMRFAYQPQYRYDGSCLGVEALLRWKHPVYGVIYPPLVVKLAEDGGFLADMEEKGFQLMLAIDDFSMGHTSINYLKDTLFDMITIDSSLIPALSELRTLGSSDPELVYKREGFNIIAPQQFSGSLHAKVPWLADSEEYRLAEPVFSPSVTIRYYRLTFRSLVPFFSRYSLEVLRLVNLDWSYTDIDVPGTDHAVFAEAAYHSDAQMLLLTKGRSLIVFRYIGKEDLLSDADLFVEMLGLPELIRGK
ncbi:MAG: EAL domain-containing protein [Firmicutes bacterium]|nr:EAL domain-containing protein [Bacillota bacterium]